MKFSPVQAFFRELMENLLAGITYMIAKLDDILVSGKNDKELRSTKMTVKCKPKFEKK